MARSHAATPSRIFAAARGIIVECSYVAVLCTALFVVTAAIAWLVSRCRA